MKLAYYLFPQESNDYKPWIITPTALAVFCVIIWAIRFLVPATISIAAPGIDAGELMSKINAERTQRFIPALITNLKLITAASSKAQDMIARSYFAHVDPDGNYVWPRIETAGYTPYITLGENLAMDFTSADEMVSAWMNSPTHRANIVNDKFQDQGLTTLFGNYEPKHDTIVAVSLFGALYKTKASYQTPYPTPYATPYPTPPYETPYPTPPATPPVKPVTIYKDIKVTSTTLSGHKLVNVNVVIQGSPTLATAKLKSQSITLLPGKTSGEYLGSFTFDEGEDLTSQTLSVEARDKAGTKVTKEFPVRIASATTEVENPNPPPVATTEIPVTNEAGMIKTLRIIFGIFAGIYMIFLIIDAIIIHKAKIKRPGIHSGTHLLVFFLVTAVSLFANWL